MSISRSERTVYWLVITALCGLVAGLLVAFGVLAAKTADSPDNGDTEVEVNLEPVQITPEPEPEPFTSNGQNIVSNLQSIGVKGMISFEIAKTAELGSGAWVGLVPSSVAHGSESVNDGADVNYVYVEAGATYTMDAPAIPGSYDLRLHDRYPNGHEIDFLTIQVTPEGHCCLCKHQ